VDMMEEDHFVRFGPREVAVATALSLVLFGSVPEVRAAGGTLRIEPASQTVAKGGTFTAKVIVNNSVPTLGAQVTVTFDKSKLQVASATWGAPFAAAPVLVPSDLSSAVTQANTSGKLAKLAATFVLPTDAVAPGDAELLDIVFKATGCGTVSLGLPVGPSDASLLDGRDATIGNTLPITTTGGSVTIDCGGNASAPASTGASPSSAATRPSATATQTDVVVAPTGGEPTSELTDAAAGETSAAETPSAPPAAAAPGATVGPGGGLPLWLPLVLSIPAIAIVGLGLLRWRRTATV